MEKRKMGGPDQQSNEKLSSEDIIATIKEEIRLYELSDAKDMDGLVKKIKPLYDSVKNRVLDPDTRAAFKDLEETMKYIGYRDPKPEE